MLDEDQVTLISRELSRRGIRGNLKEELLDHLCLLTEDKMSSGLEFESAYRESWLALGSDDVLESLENQWYFRWILNKKIVHAVGIISISLMVLGLWGKWYQFEVFRHRWFIAGNLLTGYFFLPLVFFYLISRIRPKTLLLLGFMAAQLSNLALLSQIMAWNSRHYLLPIAFIFCCCFIFHFFQIKRLRRMVKS